MGAHQGNQQGDRAPVISQEIIRFRPGEELREKNFAQHQSRREGASEEKHRAGSTRASAACSRITISTRRARVGETRECKGLTSIKHLEQG